MDGVFDALFAHNLANGISSFWAPQTADYMHPDYWDNPQLSSYFLSLWFKALGDYYWVEKTYSLFCAIIQLLLIAMAWKIYFAGNESVKKQAWLPCLLFLIIPLTSWGYSNNLMENTMSIFTTSAVIAFLLFLRSGRNLFLYASIGGALIFLALITKGPVALFPLAVPFFFSLAEQELNWKKSGLYMLVQVAVTASIFAFVFAGGEPKVFLQNYMDVQLLRAIKPQADSGLIHWGIFVHLLLALIPLLSLAIISFLITRSKENGKGSFWMAGLVFVLIGLSASAPIALSAKQNKHYLIPSLPLFALGFGCFILPLVEWLKQKLPNVEGGKLLNGIKTTCVVIVLGCGVYAFVNAGNYARDKELLFDIEQVGKLSKNQKVIRTDWSLYSDWALRANLNRFFDKKICMPDEEAATSYYLTIANQRGEGLPEDALKIYSGRRFDLYQY